MEMSCFLKDNYYGTEMVTECFTSDQSDEQLLYLGLDYIRKHDPALSLACSNNDLGRLSWNVSYRLEALIGLHAFDPNSSFPAKQVIASAIKCLLATADLSDREGSIGWPTRKYSISGTDRLSLMVDNAAILYPMLLAANGGLTDASDREKIINLAEQFYDHYEPDFNEVTGKYHFDKGIPFWADGVWLPFNMQNIWGLCLIELYKATALFRYKLRALKLAETFKQEWIYLDDGRILWHYWPQEFYDGWDEHDNLSINTPSRPASTDSLYEDLSHSGINIKFILEIYRNFPASPITASDIEAIYLTIDGFRYGDEYSRFMSGDINYQPPSRIYIPQYGWNELGEEKLYEQIKNGIPSASSLFDGDLAYSYLLTLNEK